ncbi:hypothetical protein FMUND_13137 [Fusarium mundagurra]|uniref:Uncharacterized protein n=1 Tax=Fusarium mundagurra TaxID=1567541 RepID=A0A8H6D4N0_9HYPO|nr:hypothetical protein FMUND_13137 [Fusarium mundagurra]
MESDLAELTGWKKSGTTWDALGVGGGTERIPQKAGMALAGGGWHPAESDGVSQRTLEFEDGQLQYTGWQKLEPPEIDQDVTEQAAEISGRQTLGSLGRTT